MTNGITLICPSNLNRTIGNTITFQITPTGGAPTGIDYTVNIYKRPLDQTTNTLITTLSNISANDTVTYTYTIPDADVGTITYLIDISYVCPNGITFLNTTNGCQFTISASKLSTTLLVSPNKIDIGQSVTFTVNATGGAPPYSFNW